MSSYSFQGHKRIWTPRDEEENRAIFSAQKRQDAGNIKMPEELKPVYLANAENEIEKWSIKQLMRLLRLYGAHRCLWDWRDTDSRNRKMRKAALIDITAAMGDGITRAQVVNKINVLRATYRYEKRRIKQRIRRGIGAKTKLKWFALADAFLRNVPRSEEFCNTEGTAHHADSDLEDTVVFNIDPESLIPLIEEETDQKEVEANDMHGKTSLEVRDNESVCNDSCESDNALGNVSVADYTKVLETVENNKDKLMKIDPKQRAWTQKESLIFVNLLKQEPSLWHLKPHTIKTEQQLALEHIAHEMQLPVERIKTRVHTLRRTYKIEHLKMTQNGARKPNYAWWSQAASFMESIEDHNEQQALNECEHFVDANEMTPATPANMLADYNVKKEMLEDDFTNAATPINPIPSVAPHSESVEEAMEALFHSKENELDEHKYHVKTENSSDNDYGEDGHFAEGEFCLSPAAGAAAKIVNNDMVTAATVTKLIWNGLEDDLLEGKWSLKHSVKFLRLYGAHRCLWDLSDADYRSRELRNAAIEDIAAAMGYGLTADYVAKKIKIFRITYMQHRKRMLAAIKQGKVPEIHLRWFPLADSFLRSHIGLRSIKQHEREMPQFDYQYVVANLNLIDPTLLTDFRGKGTQNTIDIGSDGLQEELVLVEQLKKPQLTKQNERYIKAELRTSAC